MSLGKRPRPSMSMMRRTASLTEFAPEFLADGGESQPRPNQEATPHPHPHPHHSRERARSEAAAAPAGAHRAYGGAGAEWLEARLAGGLPSPRRSAAAGNRRSSADFAAVETAPFLRACGLCRRRLAPGRDIFMYRGDIAFCSLECRQQQINQDERKEKCSLTSMKEAPPSTNGSEQSSNGETVAAA
ncbi:hypothetical protein ACMD2_03913 [Ananas comosus]|uniref:FLZ-type domain-containing protein n=1 Tax=Ananas comosus TaxID=4615 RepID=A0A199V676_ANACO|nr:hypothetical protein ACMD2_03913 [Ananas comosus]